VITIYSDFLVLIIPQQQVKWKGWWSLQMQAAGYEDLKQHSSMLLSIRASNRMEYILFTCPCPLYPIHDILDFLHSYIFLFYPIDCNNFSNEGKSISIPFFICGMPFLSLIASPVHRRRVVRPGPGRLTRGSQKIKNPNLISSYIR
jgi:hypothetical protein